ncbi:MAG: ribosomal L7Ae/L30e/S12e/Gadd45 family protein [Oscillospiraceae bacterium]|nr:ribosomal L7Ae/L30e/S12e/Gadd45 family protein [Oscillospiraceae bacterium]
MSSKGISGLLSICRKAGKLCMGMDMVKSACHDGEARGVYVATDLSKKSLKEMMYVCYRDSVKLYSAGMNMQEIADSIGKKTGILAICDAGFNKKARSVTDEIEIDTSLFYID